MRLFDQWSPTNFDDSVSLLSIKFCANHHYSEHLSNNKALQKVYSKIRGKAIKSLEQQSLDRIQQIMLQLVQAYRYEYFEQSELKKFLL